MAAMWIVADAQPSSWASGGDSHVATYVDHPSEWGVVNYSHVRFALGKKGGKACAEKLSPERRKEIARNAANARWDKKRREEESS